MTFRSSASHLLSSTALLLFCACSTEGNPRPSASGGAGTGSPGSAGSTAGATGGPGAAGQNGGAGTTGATGAAGSGAAGNSGVAGTGAAGSGTAGSGTAGSGTAGSGAAGSGAAGSGAAGSGAAGASVTDPPAPRPINVIPGPKFQIGQLRVDKNKPPMGKLILLLGGICGGTGAGGIESFIEQYGFHIYGPATQTCVNGGDGAHQKYRAMLTDNDPTNDALANRVVGDARMELWDGVDRVDFVTVGKGQSMLEETVAALKDGMNKDPGADYGYFLNADGTLRTSDVWVVGYSWGSQTWAMISSYVRFGRVICTSGPQAEGFPNADWITKRPATGTPGDRQFTLLGFTQPYPSTAGIDIAPNTVTSMIDTTTKAGWGAGAPVINVKPGDMGPFAPGHQIAMVGSNPTSPGGHTVFCTNNPTNGWAALCKYVFGVK
jgi:hypothetical protein